MSQMTQMKMNHKLVPEEIACDPRRRYELTILANSEKQAIKKLGPVLRAMNTYCGILEGTGWIAELLGVTKQPSSKLYRFELRLTDS